MTEMYEKITENISANNTIAIVCAVSSEGSSPVKRGAYMLVDINGRVYGTVGGGAIESNAIKTAGELISEYGRGKSVRNLLRDYDLKVDLSMVCGGKAGLLFCLIPADEKYAGLFNEAIKKEKKHESYSFLLPVENGDIALCGVVSEKNKNGFTEIKGEKFYYDTFCNEGRVFIFGSGHVAGECALLLNRLGFRYIVIDDRKELLSGTDFSTADEIIEADYKRLDNIPPVDREDYILIMTRGHKCDIDAELFALTTPARYIGMLGSRKKAEFSRQYLKNAGYAESEINRVLCPAGIDIQSQTPAEIAVSIAAQLIEKRYGNLNKK